MNELTEISKNLGLNSLQSKIIVCLLEQGGETEAPTLIKILSGYERINRTSVYLALDQLISQNLVIVCDQLNKQKTYSLFSYDPDQILRVITRSHQDAMNAFHKTLEQAKERKNIAKINIPRFYTLIGRKLIKEKMINVIQESEKYILIRGTITMLNFLLPYLEEKRKNLPDIVMYVTLTWDVNHQLDVSNVKKEIQKITGNDNYVDPAKMFREIYSWLSTIYPISNIINKTHDSKDGNISNEPMLQYAHIFTDKGKVLGSQFGTQSDFGIGFFTLDAVATLALIISYFYDFEKLTGKLINMDFIKNILSHDLNSNILPLIEKFYTDGY